MFSKAKRFEIATAGKSQSNVPKKQEPHQDANANQETAKWKPKLPVVAAKPKIKPAVTPLKSAPSTADTKSQCSSVKSVKSFVTPKPVKPITTPSSLKKTVAPPKIKQCSKVAQNDILKAQEVEIRNKDYTIAEYNKQMEDLKNEIAALNKLKTPSNIEKLDKKLAAINLNDENSPKDYDDFIDDLNRKILDLEQQCETLEREVSSKQVELTSLEEIITIRDSLCKDLQDKLTNTETILEETKQRLEMVKGHHALALDANESIRREYKVELETLKSKFEEEKQLIIANSKSDQENVKAKYNDMVESIKLELLKERDEIVTELQQQLINKDTEMKAKLEQIDEATHEKLRLCEIQFEERSRNIQEHWNQQQEQIQYLENEVKDLKYSLSMNEIENLKLHKEMNVLKTEIETLNGEKLGLVKESNDLKEESKKKLIDYENELNKLTAEVDKAVKDKKKFEMSLSVTRDIVQVLTMRLRESDDELEHLENKVQTLEETKKQLEDEVANYRTTLNNTAIECAEYKEALVNILKSKAALAKEHNRIMEHNVSLIESLQHVEKEAYRELGSIKNELIEDVELIKMESKSQIQQLRDEVEKKRVLCELATEHAGQASAAAEQSRVLLAQAAKQMSRFETENQRLLQQIQDQQSLVVELSLLRQENEELSMTVAKQSSILDKMKKDAEIKPKSPSVTRKNLKAGKENIQVVVSPLRERNHV